MSATPTFTWDDPFRTGFAGTYDPGTMYGLYFRAQQGDLAAKNHLAQNGFFDQYGNDTFGAAQNYQQAVTNWAKQKGLGVYNQGPAFQWNSAWAVPGQTGTAPGFQSAWDSFWNKGQVTPAPQGAPPQQPPPWQTQPQAPAPSSAVNVAPGYRQNPQLKAQWEDLINREGDFGGQQWTGSRWVGGGPVPAGRQLFNGQVRMPVNYNRATDTALNEFNGVPNSESNWRRVNRWTMDYVNDYGVAPQRAYELALSRLKRDATINGVVNNTGFDLSTVQAMAPGYVPGGSVPPPGGGQPGGTQPGTGNGGNPAGAPPATPTTPPPTQGLPPGYQGQNPGNSGGLTAAQRLALSDDPNQAYRYMMQQLGYNPSAPGLLGQFLKRRFQPLLEARMAASGVTDNSNYMDTIDQIINEFGGGLFQKGGNFFGGLRDIGTQAAGQAAPFLNSLQDQNQAMQYMNQLGMLRYAGGNPLVQQAVADEMQRGREAYQDEAFNRELSGQQLDPFTQWLMGTRYRNYFGL